MSAHTRHTSTSSLPHRGSNQSSEQKPDTSRTGRDRNSSGSDSPAATTASSTGHSQPQKEQESRSRPQHTRTISNTSDVSDPGFAQREPPDIAAQVEIVKRIVRPGTVLFQHQPPPEVTTRRLQQASQGPSHMDRRNPSSFQQLEKLGEGTYATVCPGWRICD